MKRHYYLFLGAFLVLAGGLGLNSLGKTNASENKQVAMSKEMASLDAVSPSGFSSDSSKINEKPADINNELVKINDELNALEDEVEVVHEETLASYYHDKFNGRKTASGEIFDNKEYSAAHKTLPFGTKVRVTNLSNDESIIVEINDRGPFSKGRKIDLSKKAFMDLTHNRNKGLLKVKVEALPDDYEEKRAELAEELNEVADVPQDFDLNEFAL